MKKAMNMSRMLYMLLGAYAVGFALFGAVTYHTINKVKVFGPVYEKVVENKNLSADIIPPPLFAVRPYALVSMMVNAGTPEQYQAAKQRFLSAEKEFRQRQAFWAKKLAARPEMVEIGRHLTQESLPPAEEFFTIVNQEVIPALDKSDRAAAHDVIVAKVDPLFQKHQLSLEELMNEIVDDGKSDEAEAIAMAARQSWILTSIWIACAVAVAGLAWWIMRAILAQNARDTESVAKLDAIGRAQAVIEFNMDGTVITANENFLNTLGYTLDEIKNRHHSMFVPETYRNSAEYREFWSRINRGEYVAGEYQRFGKGGKEVWIQASYNPIPDSNGKLVKVVKYATEVTAAVKARQEMVRILETVNSSSATLASSAEELTAVSAQMASNAEETSSQANVVSAASEQVSKNVQTVTTGVEEMNSAIREIAKNATESARVAQQAVSTADAANTQIAKLGESSVEIGNVIKVITSIAEQTNLLALNATIEAARAGEAGKGFAVVANEVKELAKETARATEDIGRKIETIQSDTKGAVDSIQQIGQVIAQINDISNTIASAVEEQTATATEMSRNVNEAAKGTAEIAQNITAVAQAAQNTTQGASNSQQAASELARMAAELQKLGAGRGTSHSLAV